MSVSVWIILIYKPESWLSFPFQRVSILISRSGSWPSFPFQRVSILSSISESWLSFLFQKISLLRVSQRFAFAFLMPSQSSQRPNDFISILNKIRLFGSKFVFILWFSWGWPSKLCQSLIKDYQSFIKVWSNFDLRLSKFDQSLISYVKLLSNFEGPTPKFYQSLMPNFKILRNFDLPYQSLIKLWYWYQSLI